MFHSVTVMLLAPLFGVPSGMYPLHHRVMHHVVNTLRIWLPSCVCVLVLPSSSTLTVMSGGKARSMEDTLNVQLQCSVMVVVLCRKEMVKGVICHRLSSTRGTVFCTFSGVSVLA